MSFSLCGCTYESYLQTQTHFHPVRRKISIPTLPICCLLESSYATNIVALNCLAGLVGSLWCFTHKASKSCLSAVLAALWPQVYLTPGHCSKPIFLVSFCLIWVFGSCVLVVRLPWHTYTPALQLLAGILTQRDRSLWTMKIWHYYLSLKYHCIWAQSTELESPTLHLRY